MQDQQLNAAESKVLQDAAFFDTKAAIDRKIKANLKNLLESIQLINASAALAPELLKTPGRQYQGEHFDNLPWRAVDTIRAIQGENIFCFRAVLIWGKHFSFNLILGGIWLEQFLPNLINSVPELAQLGLEFSVQNQAWDWQHDNKSHCALSDLNRFEIEEISIKKNWIKLSKKLPLADFEQIPMQGTILWKALLGHFTKND